MIYGNDYTGNMGYIEEYAPSTGDVFKAGFGEAISDNIITKGINYLETETMTGGSLDFVSGEAPKLVSKKDAEERARKKGVNVHNLPEEGINDPALNFLIERQYNKKVRQETISSAGGGAGNTSAEIAGGLIGSFVDPINVAMSFIPVVGQARYASWLAKAGSPIARAGIRAGVGAAEGALGAVLAEPASYLLSQELGDDYTMANSLMNVAFGTALGGGLHMTVGAFGDGLDWHKTKDTNAGKVAQQVDAASPEMKVEYVRASVAQLIEDRRVNVDPIRDAHVLAVEKQLEDIDQKLTLALASKDEVSVRTLSEQKSGLLDQLDDVGDSGFDAIKKVEDQGYKFEFSKEEGTSDFGVLVKDAEGKDVGSAIFRQEGDGFKTHPFEPVTVDAAHRRKGVASAMYAFAERETGMRVSPGESQTTSGRALWEQKNRPFGQDTRYKGASKLRGVDVQNKVRAMADEGPNSRFLNDDMIKRQTAEVEAKATVDDSMEELNRIIDEEFAVFKEDMEQAGLSLDNFKELKAIDDEIALMKENAKIERAMALCMTRKS